MSGRRFVAPFPRPSCPKRKGAPPAMRLADTVALVTGGGSGIGRAICELFAREGARVVTVDWVVSRAEETAKRIRSAGGDALAVEADVANSAAVEAMAARAIETYGRVDV